MEPVDKSDLSDIVGVKSIEGERVELARTLKARGLSVEVWMKTLDEYMTVTVQRKIREAYSRYYDEQAQSENDRMAWVLNHLSQAVAVVDQITWTEATEMALNDLLQDNPFAMEDHAEERKQQLGQLTELIRGRLTRNQRRTLVALITQDVHSRDIVDELCRSTVQSPFAFVWQ